MSMFSPDKVRELADAVTELTGGAFALQGYASDGNRYIDGRSITAGARGEFAAERMAAYYAHAAFDWASREQSTGQPVLPSVIANALAIVEAIEDRDDNATDKDRLCASRVREAADDGARDAEGRWNVRARQLGRR